VPGANGTVAVDQFSGVATVVTLSPTPAPVSPDSGSSVKGFGGGGGIEDWWIIILIIAVVCLAGVVVAVKLNKKKEANNVQGLAQAGRKGNTAAFNNPLYDEEAAHNNGGGDGYMDVGPN